MPSIAVLGPGGVGGFLAAALDRSGEPTTVVAREPTASHINGAGLKVESRRLGRFTAHPQAVPVLRSKAEVLLLATKAVGLDRALDRIAVTPELVVPLLNGLDHMDILRERFGPDRVVAGTIRIESDRPEVGRILQTSPFLRVDLASDRAEPARGLALLAETLQRAEVPAQVCSSEAQILWSKLVRLNALALTTSAVDRQIGFIRSDPEWREALWSCIDEAASVANADGADIDPAARLAELDEAHPELGSSMQRDIAAGRAPELDAIAGSVLRAGQRHGVDCPTITRLTIQVATRAGIAPPEVASECRRTSDS